MKQSDQTLRRLLAAAARAPIELRESPPFGFETAIIAGWRDVCEEGDFAPLLRIFRGATIAAVVVMTLTGVWNHIGDPDNGDTTALARYALLQLPP